MTPGTDSAALLKDGSRGLFPGEVGCIYEFLVLRVDLLNLVFSCSWRSPGWAGVCHCLWMAEGNARNPRAGGCRAQLSRFVMGLHLPPGFAEQVTLPLRRAEDRSLSRGSQVSLFLSEGGKAANHPSLYSDGSGIGGWPPSLPLFITQTFSSGCFWLSKSQADLGTKDIVSPQHVSPTLPPCP